MQTEKRNHETRKVNYAKLCQAPVKEQLRQAVMETRICLGVNTFRGLQETALSVIEALGSFQLDFP